MRFLTLLMLFAILIATQMPVTAATVDKTDHTIIAYELDEDQENAFDHEDGVLSSFWQAWDDPDNEGNLDYVEMLPETHGTHVSGADCGGIPETCPPTWEPGFESGIDDAQFRVRMAWGQKGLYIYSEATDDDFVGLVAVNEEQAEHEHYSGQEHWMNDCFDFSIDIYDSEEQRDHMVCRPSQETLSYRQYQYRFGGTETPLIIRINDPDPMWESKNDCLAWILQYKQMSITEAHQNYGILFELVEISSNVKAQEWLIPWDEVGSGISIPSRGQQLAIAMAYNDMDMSAIGASCLNPDCLFLRDRGNQFVNRPEYAEGTYCRAGENWGDIEFGAMLTEEGGETATINQRASIPALDQLKSDSYSLSGRKITGNLGANAHSTVVKRLVGTNGTRLILQAF